MLIAVEVIGRPLQFSGATYGVGERLGLDSSKTMHREMLDSDWVRRLDTVALPANATLAAPPIVAEKIAESASTKSSDTKKSGAKKS